MKTWLIVLTVIGIIVLTVVLIIDPVAETIINRRIDQASAIRGGVNQVDVQLMDATVILVGAEIYQVEDNQDAPMFSADTIVVDLQWKSLLQGVLVGDVHASDAEYRHQLSLSGQSKQQTSYYLPSPTILLAAVADSSGSKNSTNIPPFTVNNLRIKRGKLHFSDPSSDPPLTISLTELLIDGKNISNQPQPSEQLPASLKAEGITTGNGKFTLDTEMDLLPDRPSFNSNLTINEISLPELNDFFQAYTGIRMNEGQLDISSELQVNNGVIDGYIQPDLQNIEVVEFGEAANAGSGLFNKSWEMIVGLGIQALENDGEEPMRKIEIHQEYTEKEKNQQESVFESVGEAIAEAFDKTLKEQTRASQQSEQSASDK
jgi:hypothetical protein